MTWDDHEVENNYTADQAQPASATPDPVTFLPRRAAAYRAWWEHQPVRLARPSGSDLRVYRSLAFGRLVDDGLVPASPVQSAATFTVDAAGRLHGP